MPFFVYVLKSVEFDRFYVGMTSDIEKRLIQHNNGHTKSTKGYRPWKLFFFEEFSTRIEAREKDKYYKSGIGREKIREKWLRSSTEIPACRQAGSIGFRYQRLGGE